MTTQSKWKLWLAGSALTLGLTGAAVYPQISQAASTTPNASSAITQTVPLTQTAENAPGNRGIWRRADQAVDPNALLAKALNITPEQLQTAQQQARDTALDQAVTAGQITQAQADRMKQMGVGHMPYWGSGADDKTLLAKALGITVDQLNTAQEQVQKTILDQAVAGGRLTQAQADQRLAQEKLQNYLGDRMQTAYQQAVKDAVTAGVITQAQADQILQSNGPGFFGHGLFDGGMLGGRGGPMLGNDMPGGRGGRAGGRFGGDGFGGRMMPRGGQWNAPAAPSTSDQNQTAPQSQNNNSDSTVPATNL